MDIEAQIFDIFGSFIKDLSKTFPEIKNCLYRNYEKELVGEEKTLVTCPKLKTFLDLIKEHEALITKKDSSFFDLEITLLEEISFKNLWIKNISDKTRETIWKYLQTFSIITINLNSGDKLKELLETMENSEITKGDISDKQTARDLKKLKELTENITAETPNDNPDFDNMLGEMMNSDIGKIAKEVSEEMDMESIFGSINTEDPAEIMQKMLNPESMGSIFQKITSAIDNKVKKDNIDPESLRNNAQDICGQMKDNPMFSSLMKQMGTNEGQPNTEVSPEMIQEITKNMGNISSKELLKEELSKEEKRKILKQKIEQKKKIRTNN
jgi:hypothetical protein